MHAILATQGFTKNTIGQGSCKSCPVGFYQDEFGKLECKSCEYQDEEGYQDQEGQPNCKKCDVGEPINGNTECGCLTGRGLEGTKCDDCNAGKFSNSTYRCEGCPKGFYQDQEKQTSCIECPDGYIDSHNDRSKCISCPFVDESHPSFSVWGSGCPPWSTNDGCTCFCGDSGFEGDHCDICSEGKGWDGVSGEDAKCVPCGYPYVNDQTSHDAECSAQLLSTRTRNYFR